MNNHLQILQIPTLCAQLGMEYAIISPGSRNALLSVGFEKEDNIKSIIVSDERSAGFIALGISQASQKPVALICTSGSALLNYGPAVSEAYFSHVPLLIFSADRPDEWIDQKDGQTIHQRDVLREHVKSSFHLPVDTSHPDAAWHFLRNVNEAILMANSYPKQPVHVNIPIREPFYPSLDLDVPPIIRFVRTTKQVTVPEISDKLFADWMSGKRKAMIIGQQSKNKSDTLQPILDKQQGHLLFFSEVLSNCDHDNLISSHDEVIRGINDEDLSHWAPDFLITIGDSSISKGLKRLLRTCPPNTHWHFSTHGRLTDTYQSVTRLFTTDELTLIRALPPNPNDQEFMSNWMDTEVSKQNELRAVKLKSLQDEWIVVREIMSVLTQDHVLHLSNSLAVRYGNKIGHTNAHEVFCNRGTSGIDGCSSTMIGHAIVNDQKNVLITGDTAFFYDVNAFWLNELPENFCLVILNNNGGRIFGKIDGPKDQDCYEKVFVAPHNRTAENIANDYHLDYLKIESIEEFTQWLSNENRFQNYKLVEIITN